MGYLLQQTVEQGPISLEVRSDSVRFTGLDAFAFIDPARPNDAHGGVVSLEVSNRDLACLMAAVTDAFTIAMVGVREWEERNADSIAERRQESADFQVDELLAGTGWDGV